MALVKTTRELVHGTNPDARPIVPDDSLFDTLRESRGGFLQADDLHAIGDALIAANPETLAIPRLVTVTYLWKRAGGKSMGKVTLGRCVKLGGLAQYGIGSDFVIWIAADHARDLGLTCYQLEAAVHHELLHIGYDAEAGKPELRPHDFTGFRTELRQYGDWHDDLSALVDTVRQLPLGL